MVAFWSAAFAAGRTIAWAQQPAIPNRVTHGSVGLSALWRRPVPLDPSFSLGYTLGLVGPCAVIRLNMRVVSPVFLALLLDAGLANVQVAISHLILALELVVIGEVFLLTTTPAGL